MCLKVALYHTCNHPFKWIWRPCDNPLRKSLALPGRKPSRLFVPCGEGINAGLRAFTSPFSEHRADRKVCPRCKVDMRRKRAVDRKSKRAAKENLRKEKYLMLCPWVKMEGSMEGSRVDTCCIDGSVENVKPSTARNKPTIRKGYKEMPNIASTNFLFGGNAEDGETVYVRASTNSKVRFQDSEHGPWTFNEHSSGAKPGQTGSVHTAEGGGRKEAAFQDSAIPRAAKRTAAARDAAEQEAVQQRWSRFLSDTLSSANVEATVEKVIRELNAERKARGVHLAEERTTENIGVVHDHQHENPGADATSHEPIVVIAVEDKAVEQTMHFGSEIGKSESKAVIKESYTGEKMARERQEESIAINKDTNQIVVGEDATTCTTSHEKAARVEVARGTLQ